MLQGNVNFDLNALFVCNLVPNELGDLAWLLILKYDCRYCLRSSLPSQIAKARDPDSQEPSERYISCPNGNVDEKEFFVTLDS